MKKYIDAYLRLKKALEGIPPEEVQKILDQALAQVQMVAYLKTMDEKRKHLLTQTTTLIRMMRLRRTWNNRYTNCPMMGVF
jgi:hypothetical protein